MTDNIHDIWKEAVSDRQYTEENILDCIEKENMNKRYIMAKRLLDETTDPLQRRLVRNVILNSTYGLMTRDHKIYNIPNSADDLYWRQYDAIMNRYGTMDQPIRSFEISHERGYGKQISMGSFDEFYLDTDIAYSIFLSGEEHHKLALDSVIHWNVKFVPTIIIPPMGRGCKSWMLMKCFMHPRYKIKVRPGNEYYLKDLRIDMGYHKPIEMRIKEWVRTQNWAFDEEELDKYAKYMTRIINHAELDEDWYSDYFNADITNNRDKKQLERIAKRRNHNDSKRKRGKAR